MTASIIADYESGKTLRKINKATTYSCGKEKGMKRYIYYVCYTCNKGDDKANGYLEAKVKGKLKSWNNIKELIRVIEEKNNVKNVVITNFILLRKVSEKKDFEQTVLKYSVKG